MVMEQTTEPWNDIEEEDIEDVYFYSESEESEDEFLYNNTYISPELYKVYDINGEVLTDDLDREVMIPSFLVPNSTLASINFPYRKLKVAEDPVDCDLDELAELTLDTRFTSEQFYWVVGQITIPLHHEYTSLYSRRRNEFIRHEDAYILPELGFAHPLQKSQIMNQPHCIDDIPYDWCQIGLYAACRAHFRISNKYLLKSNKNEKDLLYILPAKYSKNNLCVSRYQDTRIMNDNEDFHDTITSMLRNTLVL